MMNQFKLPKHPIIIYYSHNSDDSLGLFFINGVFQHYIIADEPRAVKVMHETRLSAGVYPLRLRTVGGFHIRYTKKYPKFHEGMIEAYEVPNFKYILYHQMNTDDHTSGCFGGGNLANNNQIEEGFTGQSALAYQRTYPKLLEYVKTAAEPIIEVIALDL